MHCRTDGSPPPPSSAECRSLSAAGDCCSAACLEAANPNIPLGVAFQAYNPSCLGGGLGCVGLSGCRMCRLADASLHGHLPVCPACVCRHYGLPAAKCDRSGQGRADPPPRAGPSPPPPAGGGPSNQPPIDWGQPILVEKFDGPGLPALFDVEVDCWVSVGGPIRWLGI